LIRPAELIQRKRDGEELSDDEIHELVLRFGREEIPDYQLAAFCMAVYFRGLSKRETFALTEALVASGDTIDLRAAVGRPVADKHSTGGVGDKTSLVVGPLVAACGVPFGKMSGRGLGHTGGTLDKLESIPGFRVELSRDEFAAQVRDVGLAIVGQTAELVPADKRLYGLRDVTATVDNVSLIAAAVSVHVARSRAWSAGVASPFCRLCHATPGTSSKGASASSGMERRRSLTWVGLPCQHRPTLKRGSPAGGRGGAAR
jgi:pyrimidine-nucleoside phosphorylase